MSRGWPFSRIVKSDCVSPVRCVPWLSVTTTSIVRGALLIATSSAAAAKANSIAADKTANRKRTIPGLLSRCVVVSSRGRRRIVARRRAAAPTRRRAPSLNRGLRKPRLLRLLIHHADGYLLLSPAEHHVHIELDHLVGELLQLVGR